MIPRRISESIARHTARRFNRKDMCLDPARPIVSFTFDDIPVSAAVSGARCLEDFGVLGTFYVSGDLLEQMSDYGVPCAGVEMIESLAARGHEIGCHSFAHRRVGEMSAMGLREDLARNASILRDVGPLQNFAYPYNAPATQAKRILGERFRSARGGLPGINRGAVDLTYLRAVPLQAASIQGLNFEQWIAEACATPGWLVFFTHDVASDPSPYGTTPQVLRSAIRQAQRYGAAVKTVAAALDDMAVPVCETAPTDREPTP